MTGGRNSKSGKVVYWRGWAKTREIEDLEKGTLSEPMKALLKRRPNQTWTTRHAAQARSWVIKGACTQKEALRHKLG